MVGRVNGVNFTGIYGGTTAMGWHKITKPPHFTWQQYAEFLLSTLPAETKKKFEDKIAKSRWHWRVQGGARSQDFIAQLEREGWKIRRTHKPANRGHRVDELIYLDEMMDDTDVDDFRRAPTWKRVCITILKNDASALFMGFQRTTDQNILRARALERYKRIKMPKELQGKSDEKQLELEQNS
jgi:predicted phosphoadenosine phosphosulfate sulfurtransferase